ncbi:hypothetical protein EDC01DRAFT_630746 [Geopyxis carbonaria]|nr:hypothetical protein EDC01DRAFT_630746 [Geopyxis carbonaria]
MYFQSIHTTEMMSMEITMKDDATQLSVLQQATAEAEAKLQRIQAEIEMRNTEINNKNKVLAQLDHDIQLILNILPMETFEKQLDPEPKQEDDNSLDDSLSYMSISTATWEARRLRL